MSLSCSLLVSLHVLCQVGNFKTDFHQRSLTFASILPALAFSLDMYVHVSPFKNLRLTGLRFSKTNMSYGVNEVLLASVLGALVFSVFAAQPLVIVGVTGI